MKKVTLYFDFIDCASCAKEVEEAIAKDKHIVSCSLDYLNKSVDIVYDGDVDILELVNKLAQEEEEVNFSYKRFKDKKKLNIDYLFIISLCLFIPAFILELLYGKSIDVNNTFVKYLFIGLYTVSYILMAYKIILKAIKNILKGDFFDENFLMFIASLGAMILSYLISFNVLSGHLEFLEAIMVILLYRVGEFIQDKALDSSTDNIKSLSKLTVDEVTLKNGEVVETDDVKLGEEIIVKAGERIPLDGVITEGNSSFDTKDLTGESLPLDLTCGDEVLSGYINLSKVIIIKVTKVAKDSTSNKIKELVEAAGKKKSKAESFITKFSKIYTPVVIILALLVFLVEWLLIDKFSIYDSLNNAFVFLVSSCPCALLISIPLAMFGGIGKCSTFGILVKGGNYLEALNKVKQITFDKTGTLTKGNFMVSKVDAEDVNLFLEVLSSVESYSNHPISVAVSKYYEGTKKNHVRDVEELAGYGIKAIFDGKVVLCGNKKLMDKYGIEVKNSDDVGTIVYAALDGKYLGYALIVDEIKEESYGLIQDLKLMSIKTYILTGDKENVGKNVVDKLQIDEGHYELLPNEKLEQLEEIIKNKEEGSSVVYIGDGINDTPALKIADVGIAVSSIDNDSAVEASDIVLMNSDMNNVRRAIEIAKFTRRILVENVIFALAVKVIVMVIGMLGILGSYGMFLGVFADVGVCLLCILNTLRILKRRIK